MWHDSHGILRIQNRLMFHDMPRLDAGELQIDAFIADKHDTASEILSNTTIHPVSAMTAIEYFKYNEWLVCMTETNRIFIEQNPPCIFILLVFHRTYSSRRTFRNIILLLFFFSLLSFLHFISFHSILFYFLFNIP